MEDKVLDVFASFTLVRDPRKERGRRHRLLDVIIIALCGALCGVDNAEELEEFGQPKEGWFRTFLELPFGIPSQDTFLRVFAALEPGEFRQAFVAWVERLRRPGDGRVLAVDGKSLRRAFDAAAGELRVHMVSAYLSEAGLVLASVRALPAGRPSRPPAVYALAQRRSSAVSIAPTRPALARSAAAVSPSISPQVPANSRAAANSPHSPRASEYRCRFSPAPRRFAPSAMRRTVDIEALSIWSASAR